MRVLLYGIIAEKAGAAAIDVQAASLGELRLRLAERVPGIEQLSHAIAVDRQLVRTDMPLSGSEEIAVLPPFAGG